MMSQWNVVQNGLCGRFNIKSLKKIMFLIGSAGLASNKQVLAENIIKQCKIFEQWEEDHYYSAQNNSERKTCTGIQVVAVDMGISNFSFTKFNLKFIDSDGGGRDQNIDVIPEITAWGKYDLSNVYEHILNPNYPRPYCGASCKKKTSSSSDSSATKTSTSVSNSNSNLKYIQFNPMTVNRLADEIIYDLLSESKSGSFQTGTPVVTDVQLQGKEKEQRNIKTQKIKDTLSKTVFLFEHQRTRTLSSSNVLESVYRNSVLEYILFTKLETYTNVFLSNTAKQPLNKSFNFQADPKKMCDYWIPNEITDKLKTGVDMGGKKTSKSKISKQLRIKLVQNMFSQLQNKEIAKFNQVDFQLSESFVENYKDFLKNMDECSPGTKKSLSFYNALSLEKLRNGQKKDDDLCDSFLHGMAWIQWFRAYLKLKPVFLENKEFCTNNEQLNNIIDSINKEHETALAKIEQYLLK